jgi:hypothetical protein
MVSEELERVKVFRTSTSLVYRTGYLPFKQEERVQLPREVLAGCRLEWFQRGLISPMAEAYVGSIPTSPIQEAGGRRQ